jgi:type-F conjugative transfer system secretin TraK
MRKKDKTKINYMKSRAALLSMILVIFSLSQRAYASQNLTIEDGEEFTAEISKTDLNRVKLVGDRIRDIKINNAEIEYSQDNKLGELYFRPTPRAEAKPINLFILTEQGFTYKALLIPKSIPAEQIIIRNDAAVSNSDSDVSKSTKNPYEQQIIVLMKVMRTKNKLDGYQIKQERKYVDLGDLSMRRTHVYKGQNFIGEIFVLKNSTNQVLGLEEKMFFKNGVRAIKIENPNLLPDESTEILIVS